MAEISLSDLVPLDGADPGALKRLLADHRIGLREGELERLRRLLGRNPTIVELHIFNAMWSEHCSYKSSRLVLKKYLPTKAPYVVLGPGEDAGIVRFLEKREDNYCLVMAHESHNHPSQVLPVEGAATGIGGIVRDVYCMGADVIGVLDPLRFGDPDGPQGARVCDIARGVIEGIAQYANALGVPNLGGETVFDGSFDDNCIVNVVALGIVKEKEIVRSLIPPQASDLPYEIILVGKPTDESGFGGAAFASERLSSGGSVESQEAVQVPDPFLKRVLVEATKEVLALVRSEGATIGFKDLGAGGISCAVSEMAAAGGFGVEVHLEKVNCVSGEMRSEVIACSETQERYAMAAPKSIVDKILEIYNERFELPGIYTGAGAFVIGSVTRDKLFKLIHRGKLLCSAGVDVITSGIEYERPAKRRQREAVLTGTSPVSRPGTRDALLRLLAAYNIADKELVFRHYDSEVQGRAVLRPGEADAAVAIFLPGEVVGLAVAAGGNSSLAAVDPYLGGAWAVCEAVRNVACVGAKPLTVTDCLNYGDPEDPHVFWDFSEGVRGIGEACRGLSFSGGEGLPVVSGNVSFYNQSGEARAVAPSPIVACAGRVEDVRVCRGFGFKRAGSRVVLIGRLHCKMGGSEYARIFGPPECDDAPGCDFSTENSIVESLLRGFEKNLILAAHDISHGGLLVTVSEMIIQSAPQVIGCSLDLGDHSADPSEEVLFLFSEYGGVIVEVVPGEWPGFEEILERAGAPWREIGSTEAGGSLRIRSASGATEVGFEELASAFRGKLRRLFGRLGS